MIFIIGVYNFVIFMQRRNDKGSLYLAMFCFLIVIRGLMTGHFFSQWIDIESNMLYEIRYCLEYLSLTLSPLFFLLFADYCFPEFFHRKIVKILAYGEIILSIPPIVLAGMYFTPFLFIFQLTLVICSGYVAVRYTLAAIKNAEGARFGILGALFLLFTLFYDVLVSRGILPQPYIINFGVTVFILAQSLVIGKKFAVAFQLSELLSKKLQIEVDRQTRSIKSILKNLKQGIFTVYEPVEGKISNEYSLFLEEILQTKDIKDRSINEILLKSSKMDADKISQVSGRGVGMGAIRKYLTDAGGTISIDLKKENTASDFNQFGLNIKLPTKYIDKSLAI